MALVGIPRPSLVQWPSPKHGSCIVGEKGVRCKAVTFPRGEGSRLLFKGEKGGVAGERGRLGGVEGGSG